MLDSLRGASPTAAMASRAQPLPASPLSFLDPPTVPGNLGRLGPYRVVAELGRGGMAVVYQARHATLNRVVALKMILAADATSAAVQRFRNEAEAVVTLDHPHIVPIYEVDEHQGRPYFSMKLIKGGSLAQALHGNRLGQREAVDIMAKVARAVHYAHQRGILHRDLKPSNILLDTDCQPYVADFGVAKRTETDSALTQSGVVLGTPSYMAPEQAAGRTGAVTTLADVYGLGAVLYEVVTRRPPFRGETVLETIRQVQEKDPARPSDIDPRVDRDVETICLKCLQKDPRRRYASAHDLAEDLDRYLAGKPIRARPVGAWERLGKWRRRHPAAAILGTLCLLLFLAGFGLVAWQWRRAEAEAEDARRHFQLARETVDRYLTAVSEDPQVKAGNVEPLRRQLLALARDYYEAFVRDHADDADLRAELGRAYGRLGIITSLLDAPPQSLPYFQQKQGVFERLCQDHPQEADYRRELADTYWHLGYGLHYAGQGQAAWDAFQQARRLWEELAEQYPDEPEYPARLIRTLNSLGRSYCIHGQTNEAEPIYQDGEAAYARWTQHHAAEARHQESYAWLRANQGSLFCQSGRLEAAPGPLKEAVALAQSLVDGHAKEPAYQDLLRHALTQLGQTYRLAGQPERAEAALRKAYAVAARLAQEHPAGAEYRAAVAETLQQLAQVLCDGGNRPTEAHAAFREALAIHEKLMDEYPDSKPFYWMFWGSWCDFLDDLQESGQLEAALEQTNKVIRRWEGKTSRDQPGYPEQHVVPSCYGQRARTLLLMKRFAAARQDVERAIRMSNGEEQAGFQRLRDLTDAAALLEQGSLARAAAAVQTVAARTPKDGQLLYFCAVLFARCAAAAAQDSSAATPERISEIESYAVRALVLLRQAKAAGYFRLQRQRARLGNDLAFEPLRGRADFRRLLAELAEVSPTSKADGPH
jgi:tetratricopeptide (TPR) repeat protein/predicted Ser/Thr protein kinase